MATFELGDGTPPSATESATTTMVWPMFPSGQAVVTAGVIDAGNARSPRHIRHIAGEHVKRYGTG